MQRIVLLEDYSDPVDIICSKPGGAAAVQTDIYCDPVDCQALTSKSQTKETDDPNDIYDVPPDDDYTDPYESGLADVISKSSCPTLMLSRVF